MQKGQAFDTFKLMIAAVVAVAILGILLGILGGISTPGQGFDDTAKQLITRATNSPGAIYPSSGEVSFEANSLFPSLIFESSSGGKPVLFDCNDYTATDGNKVEISKLCIGGSSLEVLNSDFRQRIYVCCGSGSCKIKIGTTKGIVC